MPVPGFVVELRRHIGHAPLWLIGVTAVVLRTAADGHTDLLLVRRADTGEWAPVSGIVDPGEDPHVCAIREAAEEACVQIRVERLVWMCAGDLVEHRNGDQAWYLDHTFRCHWVSGEPAVGDDESLEARWWPAHDLPPMRPLFADRVAAALENLPETRFGPRMSGVSPADAAGLITDPIS